MKKLRIQIICQVPEVDQAGRLKFVEGVLELFRAIFPTAEALPYDDPGYLPPVTVYFPDEEGDAAEVSMESNP